MSDDIEGSRTSRRRRFGVGAVALTAGSALWAALCAFGAYQTSDRYLERLIEARCIESQSTEDPMCSRGQLGTIRAECSDGGQLREPGLSARDCMREHPRDADPPVAIPAGNSPSPPGTAR